VNSVGTTIYKHESRLGGVAMWDLAFIEHAQIQPILTQLNDGVRRRFFIPFVIQDGGGKRRVLVHWAKVNAQIDLNKIVWCHLVHTNKKNGRREAIASPITMMTFGRTFYALHMLRNPLRAWDKIIDQSLVPLYDDDRFISLRDKVGALMKNQGIRVWIIENAHLLDSRAMKHIVALWKECDRKFSVILAAKQLASQQPEEPLTDQLESVPDLKYYARRRIELSTIGEEEFCTDILATMFDDLRAEFSAEVERNADTLAARAWDYTHGHWDAVTRLATEFDEALGQSNRAYRLVTPQVVDQVFAELLPPVSLED
jgi:hypothetical protein